MPSQCVATVEEVELLAYGLARAIAGGEALVWPLLLCGDFPLPLFNFEGALCSSRSAHCAAYHAVRNEELNIISKFQHQERKEQKVCFQQAFWCCVQVTGGCHTHSAQKRQAPLCA